MDWDSPSHETGTVRRRPASFDTAPVSTDRLENVEYYELRDCVGGYGLTLLKSIDRPFGDLLPGFLAAGSKGIEAINDNGDRSPSSCKEGGKKEEEKTCEKDSNDLPAFSDFSNRKEEEEKFSSEVKKERIGGRKKSDEERSKETVWKINNARKDFGLRLARVSGPTRRKSLIPRPRTRRYVGRGLVNSSSESSGIGSPLSPLSPSNDASTITRGGGGSIKSSGSKSSGFGSPDDHSPLSPESQRYTAFYLIEQQLEKLRNCGCERRQAQVLKVLNF